jgi:glycosyltransferase involved in cell wall biosynthesis
MLSIIIPTFNRNELLRIGLESISKQEIPCEYEIIILNEYVDDESRNVASKYNARYILTRPNETLNSISWRCPCIAINHGVKQAKGEYIIIACPEIWHAFPINIKNLLDPISKEDKVVAILKGYDDNGKVLSSVKSNKPVNYTDLNTLQTEFPFFLAMRKSNFIAIGGYDEDFMKGFAFDDTNFVQRLKNYGCKYITVEGAIVHLFHPRLRYNLDHVKTLWTRNKLMYESRLSAIVANVGQDWGKL